MAKTGFPFYRAETDRFQDIKIKRLKKRFHCTGYAVYQYILNEIYRVEGCYLQFGEDELFDVADYWGIDEEEVRAITRFCCEVGLFDEQIYDANGILTARSIQSRYVDMCRLSKRRVIIPETYLLLQDEIATDSPKNPAPQPIIRLELESETKVSPNQCAVETLVSMNNPTDETLVSLGQNSRETTVFSRKNEEIPEKVIENQKKTDREEKNREKTENIPSYAPRGQEEEILLQTRERLKAMQMEHKRAPMEIVTQSPPTRNTEGLLYELGRYQLTPAETEEVLKLTNYGEIGGEVWKIIAHIATNGNAIKSPRFFLLSKLRNGSNMRKGGRRASWRKGNFILERCVSAGVLRTK